MGMGASGEKDTRMKDEERYTRAHQHTELSRKTHTQRQMEGGTAGKKTK